MAKKVVITFGTFDLFHIGHKNILERAKEYGDILYVGVSSDWFTSTKKGIFPIQNENTRIEKIKSLSQVTDVFLEESLELKSEYIKKYKADILIMGDDWKGKFDNFNCKTIYLPRTPDISSTIIKNKYYPYIPSVLQSKLKLHGTYNHPLTPTSEIFPLKIYKFYGHEVYGPNRYDTMENYYSKEKPMMEYAKIKWTKKIRLNKNKGYFRLTDFSPDEYHRDKKIKKMKKHCNRKTKACIYTKRKYIESISKVTISKCCRYHLNDILLFATELLKKNNIPYFVYWGTLLGIIRHNGSIPWDTDQDLYILDIYREKFNKLIPIINKTYFVTIVNRTFYRINFSRRNRAHLDVYIAEQIHKGNESREQVNPSNMIYGQKSRQRVQRERRIKKRQIRINNRIKVKVKSNILINNKNIIRRQNMSINDVIIKSSIVINNKKIIKRKRRERRIRK